MSAGFKGKRVGGLNPLDSMRLGMFTPLVLAFAVALEIAVARHRADDTRPISD